VNGTCLTRKTNEAQEFNENSLLEYLLPSAQKFCLVLCMIPWIYFRRNILSPLTTCMKLLHSNAEKNKKEERKKNIFTSL
jgi:hypothetical protein